MKKFLNISLFFVCVFGTCFSANAANIPTCDNKNVLQWIENTFLKMWTVPKDKANLQMEFLVEIHSQQNERKCEVTFRSKLSPSGLKEMNSYLETWNKETGNRRPPDYLLNFSTESVNKFTFLLKYDLIKKDWFGQYYSPVPDNNTPLGNYRIVLKGELLNQIQREKAIIAREEEWISNERVRDAQLKERAEAIERARKDKFEKEKKSKEPTEVSEKFGACVYEKLGNKIKYPDASRRLDETGIVEFNLEFINGVYNSARIVQSPYKRLSEAVLKALSNLNCSHIEEVNGSIEMKFDFVLN